ncbi:ABC transporter substrate-binding protein [Jannaschia aquimarina]|uniref:GsiB_1 protein n=1 Tax=Jannaschia aquimarina TaxID=935700 RepID=A0A0D1EBB5_9RHOB|nr:ABC transporter substrate-binding protein [Jannaschia aquimarina]KIT15039.1 Glutathione-binding protein GsiB precursor [Jannaschia aquimarina]SNS62540.1 peptide/nickel transport system substrate-binding protein [Jannaschia aquimarina]
MSFTRIGRGLIAAAIALPLTLSAAAAETTLRVIPHADLKNLDPIWTTAYITRNHGYMIYDTLFAMDENFEVQPQMVDTWTESEDGLTWEFTLRDGLTFHDGAPVTSEDVIASLERWGARDGMGQQLMASTASMEAVDDSTFRLTLSEPFGLVLQSLGKISSNVPFIMPARVAATDPFEQIEDFTGSGPFVFQEDEWVPGNTVVYTKFEDYVPRDEPASAAAGGKVANVDRVVWQYFPDNTTAMNALMTGEVDFFEQPAPDLTPILESNPDVTVEINDPLGNIGFARFNHLLPPFDDAEVRRAAIMAMRQEDYMASAVGDEQFWSTCFSVYPCGTPLESDAGAEVIMTGDVEAAKAALAETDYDGTPVVIMQPTDIPVLSAFSLVTADKLRDAGFTVDMQAMDWATLTSRRASREPVADGGWNIFHTWWIGADVIDPMAIAFSGDPDGGWFGWAEDAELEAARAAFARATTPEEREASATAVQERLWAIGASGQLGQFFVPVAYRNNVEGLIKSPVQFFWNISVE